MKLYLLRHAEASPGKPDAFRKLSHKGIATLQKLADFTKEKSILHIEEIRHSPLIRAKQSAESFRNFLDLEVPLREVPLLEPLDDFRITANILSHEEKNVLLVGHQPHLGMLASYLLTQNDRIDLFNFKKAGLMLLEKHISEDTEAEWASSWQLRWLIVPKLLKNKKIRPIQESP